MDTLSYRYWVQIAAFLSNRDVPHLLRACRVVWRECSEEQPLPIVWEGKVCVPPRRCPHLTVMDFTAGPVHRWGGYGAFKVRISQLGFAPAGFPRLHTLDVHKTLVSDLRPLRHCPQLQHLRCALTPIDSLDGLQSCPRLTHLECQFTSVRSLQPLRGCARLQSLRCNHTKIASVAPLHACTALRHLVLSHTAVRTLTGLEACTQLRTLVARMWSPQISSLQPLRAAAPALQEVDLTIISTRCAPTRGVNSVAPLQGGTQLRAVRLLGNCVRDWRVLPSDTYLQCHVPRTDADDTPRAHTTWLPCDGGFVLTRGTDVLAASESD